jgi:hypothetical protein
MNLKLFITKNHQITRNKTNLVTRRTCPADAHHLHCCLFMVWLGSRDYYNAHLSKLQNLLHVLLLTADPGVDTAETRPFEKVLPLVVRL